MAARKKERAPHRAETRGGGLSCIPHVVQDAPAYLALSPFERAVLSEILRLFNGYNNGEIAITYERIGNRLKGQNRVPLNNRRIANAVARLVEHGLLGEPTPGSWLQRRARTYRITFVSSGKSPPFRPATSEYRYWTPRDAKTDGNGTSPDSASRDDRASLRVNDIGDQASPMISKNGGFRSVRQIGHW